ncbi:class I SAM-dependent methyltransferase [Aquimarina aquimarini]|uniref:class I SAM-dependent methyltransferase n=1 Tax=Aquimarina aquimarini TaxID=1191734 RepID=UPI000D54B084|nr:class I SAM-dependent methyltransferase [Aquimarina aquimarini]
MNNSWNTHYHHFDQKKYPPAATLVKTLEFLKKTPLDIKNKLAIDLGCGNGIDTFAMLQEQWNVLAIDKQNDALLRIKDNIPVEHKDQLQLDLRAFENIDTLPDAYLINATFSLPFCHPDHFEKLWHVITSAIPKNGFFSGHLFGHNDSWNSNPEMTFHTVEKINELFKEYHLHFNKEIEKQGTTISGKTKHWHVFHIVAQKK